MFCLLLRKKKYNVLSVNQSAALKTFFHFFKSTFQAQKTFRESANSVKYE